MGMLTTQSEPTIHHFSHTHPLHLTHHNPNQTLAPSSCSGCKVPLTLGLTYTCTLCNYYLHTKCSQMPQQIKHPFDQSHVFSLLTVPEYPGGVFKCDACGDQGTGFSYQCKPCGTDLHILCASMPLSTTHHSHHHSLNLIFSPPYLTKNFSCDVCKNIGGSHWLYRCNLCEFDAHLSCGTSKVLPPQAHPTAQMHQYQRSASVPIHVVQPPPQVLTPLQQYMSGYGAAAGIPTRGTPQMNPRPFSFMNHVNTGVPGQYNPSANNAFNTNNQGTPCYYPNAPPASTAPQMFQGQTPGRGGGTIDATLQALQILQQMQSGGGGGANLNAQLLQAILDASNNGGGGGGNAQVFQAILNGSGGGGGNDQQIQGLMGGGGNDQLIQGLMGGGGGGGGFDVSSLVGGNVDISSLMGLMGGFGLC